jgi:hypothetical protein
MTAAVTGGGTATGRPAPPRRRAARRRFALPRASTTPGKVRLIRMGLEAGVVVLALIMATGSAWGLSRRLAEYR